MPLESEIPQQSSEYPDSSIVFDCPTEALKYVAGFLAHKLRDKYPDLGEKTSETLSGARTESPWIHALSRGGLTAPSSDFMRKIISFEKIFKNIHGNSLYREEKVISFTIASIVKQFPKFPLDVIKKYVRTRIFIRIKFLNHQIRTEKEAKKNRNARKTKHFVS